MEYKRWLWITGAVLAVALCEIWFHWLASVNPYVLGVYLTPGKGNKYFIGACIDTIFPAISLGAVIGWLGFPELSDRKVVLIAFALAMLFAVAMLPVYSNLVGKANLAIIWGQRRDGFGGGIDYYHWPFFSTFVLLGVCTHGAYESRRDWERRRV
jgi:hypothetical protein